MNKRLFVCMLWVCGALVVASAGCPAPLPVTDGKIESDASQDGTLTESTPTEQPTPDPTIPPPDTPQPDTTQPDPQPTPDQPTPDTTPDTAPDAAPDTAPDATPDDANRPFGLTQRIPNTTCKVTGRPDALTAMRLTNAFANLQFSRPLFLTHAGDGTDRMFVVEQGGKILVFPNKSNAPRTDVKTFIDITTRVSRDHNEEGLLGLAFHPKYKQNGYFYLYYSAKNPRRSVVSRFSVKANDPNQADPASERKILEIGQPYGNHNGGVMAFGPDGYLYIAVGDGGSSGDPQRHGQNLGTLLGSILRIDIDKQAGGKEYAIPADNPFINQTGALPEIWAYGLRNVWRMSFDRDNGTLWAGDVGQGALEEIDVIVKGGNYGWRAMEGTKCYNPSTNCKQPGMILPIVEHDRTEAKSITGGYVYRGSRLPSLYGAYIYGDYVSGLLWAIRYDGTKVTEQKQLMSSGKNIASFGEDQHGELYILAFDGKIYQLDLPQGGTNNFPTTLTQTGCFKTLQPLTPADGLIPYDVKVPLWSDQLDKLRWLALPGTTQITYTKEDAWDLPEGSVVLKHFSYERTKGDPATRYHVETRLMVKDSGEWRGYSYQWNAAQTEATLVTGRTPVAISQTNPGGNPLAFTHTIPSLTDCMACHTSDAGRLLGVQTRQLNSNFDYKGVVDNQLRAMNNIQLFTQPLAAPPAQLPTLPAFNDANAPIESRVKAYLHSNCSHCHRPGLSNNGEIDLRFTTDLKGSKACNADPQEGTLGIANAKIIVPGAPDRSLLYRRMKLRNAKGQMPPIATVLEDTAATDAVRQWITGLNQCP